jgi:hypothetical protein
MWRSLALRPVHCHSGDVRGGAEVLVRVRLVDEEIVDPNLLETDPGVLRAVELLFEALLRLEPDTPR